MKLLRQILCSLLAILLLSSAALAETYTDDWGNGVTLNFELDDSLLQPLDIFDTVYWLDPQNPTDEEIADSKVRLQKAAELTYKGEIPEIQMTAPASSGTLALTIEKDQDNPCEYVYIDFGRAMYHDMREIYQYCDTETFLDNYLSTFYEHHHDTPYPASREDYYVEHDFMTHDEADAKARAFMTAMHGDDSPFDVVLRDWYGITHEQFSDMFNWKVEHDLFKQPGVPSYFTGDEWTDVYDAYYLLYSYTYKGYPICDWVQTMYSGRVDNPVNPTGYSTECLINREGFVYVSERILFDCDYTPYEDTPALTLYEALDVLKQYLGGIKGLNPIQISRVYVEYLPLATDDDPSCKRTFEPIWSFVADMTTDYGVLEEYMVYRVNGHTGQIMTNGYGIIQ